MVSRRARRAAFRFWFSVALFPALSVAPLAPAFAWTPPPRPLPMEPADTDGIDDDIHNNRPGPRRPDGTPAADQKRDIGSIVGLSEARAAWSDLELRVIQLLRWLDQR